MYAIGRQFRGFATVATLSISYSTVSWLWNSGFDGSPEGMVLGIRSITCHLVSPSMQGQNNPSPSRALSYVGPCLGTWGCHCTPVQVSEPGSRHPLGWGGQSLMKYKIDNASLACSSRVLQMGWTSIETPATQSQHTHRCCKFSLEALGVFHTLCSSLRVNNDR